jgi:Ni/Fe-hydrogenase 1 B-type cytochrome subunit
MQAVTVSRVFVWSRWLRLSHWLMAVSVLGLLATGWLMRSDPILAQDAAEIHFMLSAILIPALLVRLYLLFAGQGTDQLSDCEPNLHRMAQAWEVVRFYLTLGRVPLPKWFGHNPLWGPVYLFLFLFLTLAAISGVLLLQDLAFLLGISQFDIHRLCYYAIGLFTLLHVPAVFSHDLSNRTSDISGMVNGYKVFLIEDANPVKGVESSYSVSLQDLLKTRK